MVTIRKRRIDGIRHGWLFRKSRAMATIEVACILPVIFLAFIAIVYASFYYHDKNILCGAAYETAVVVSERCHQKNTTSDGTAYFQDRVAGKLLFFETPECRILLGENEVQVEATAAKNRMKLSVRGEAAITEPEDFIRDIRAVQEAGKEMID